ncbi:cupredoxin domain-containing protein [Baekduia sp. Peel2402]|uniref:cupredoxin domain-containing protein n=1 Tax=Baekduia sp. Peel2402 TaxID=3458296 RepID=UPI00403E698B
MTTMLSIGTAAVAVAALTGSASVAAASAHTTIVTLKHISFVKETVRIHKGDKVKWVWKDPTVPHNVTFAKRHSKTQQTGIYTLTFARSGTFTYHCTIHPGMNGKVVVL